AGEQAHRRDPLLRAHLGQLGHQGNGSHKDPLHPGRALPSPPDHRALRRQNSGSHPALDDCHDQRRQPESGRRRRDVLAVQHHRNGPHRKSRHGPRRTAHLISSTAAPAFHTPPVLRTRGVFRSPGQHEPFYNKTTNIYTHIQHTAKYALFFHLIQNQTTHKRAALLTSTSSQS